MSLTHKLPPTWPSQAAQTEPRSTSGHITLPRGATCSRRSRAGSRLQIESGRAWVTLSGDTRDHFLTAGQHLPLPTGAVVVIEGDSSQPTRVCWR